MKITSKRAIKKPILGTSFKKKFKVSGIQYSRNFNITLVNPILIIQSSDQKIYIILNFSRYLLL